MYTLYYSPFSCSLAVHIALEKIGIDFKLEKIDLRKGMHQTAEFLKLSPHGKVPLLQDDDVLIDQGGGILLYLSEKHPEAGMMPPVGEPERAAAISFLFYMSNTVHPTLAMAFYPDRFTDGLSDDVLTNTIERTKQLLVTLNQSLEGKDFLCGSKPYAADYYLVTIMNWLQVFKITLDDYPNLQNYKQRMGDLPEVGRAVGTEMTEF